jgi:hypothetical protein
LESTVIVGTCDDPAVTGFTVAIIAVPLSIGVLAALLVDIAIRYEPSEAGLVILWVPTEPNVAKVPRVTLTSWPAVIPVVELSVIVIEPAPPDATVTPSFAALAEDERPLSTYGPPEETAKSTSV